MGHLDVPHCYLMGTPPAVFVKLTMYRKKCIWFLLYVVEIKDCHVGSYLPLDMLIFSF
jgi:hypothetical protein